MFFSFHFNGKNVSVSIHKNACILKFDQANHFSTYSVLLVVDIMPSFTGSNFRPLDISHFILLLTKTMPSACWSLNLA